MTNAKISIIVPVYNREEYLKKCIDSIVSQSYKNLEIILVDDGSTDSSLSVCREYENADSRIIVISKENGGVSSARNAGLDSATGDFIGFVDSDDYIEEDMYERLIQPYFNSETDLVCCGMFYPEQRRPKAETEYSADEACALMFDIENKNAYIKTYCCNKLYKASIIKNNSLCFDTGLVIAEDHKFNFDYIINCKRVCVIPFALYHYVWNESSATNNYFQSLSSKESDMSDYFLAHAKSERLKEAVLKWAATCYYRGIIYGYCNKKNGKDSFNYSVRRIKNEKGFYLSHLDMLNKKQKLFVLSMIYAPRLYSFYKRIRVWKA